MPKPSMKGALGASISAETAAFQERLAKADAHSQQKSAVSIGSDETETALVAKVMREAFTIPEAEHTQIESIRTLLLSQAVAVSKSEVLRAGLLLLAEADLQTKLQIFERLERVKTGRPKTS